MLSAKDLDTTASRSGSQDAFDRQVADIVRLLESLRNDWAEIRDLVDEVVLCESALEADAAAMPSELRIRVQTELNALNARLWELTHGRDVARAPVWPIPSSH
jgi:hypothetical protein